MGRVRLADLALEVRDEGRGPPVLLLHGFPTTNRLWDGVFPALRDAGLRCIAPDLAGYGLSDSPGGEPGMERQAGWLAELLDGLGVESALIVAHDVGSAAAQILVAADPRRANRVHARSGLARIESARCPDQPQPALLSLVGGQHRADGFFG